MLRLLPSLLISNAELDVFLDKFGTGPAGRRRKAGLSGVSDHHVHIESDSAGSAQSVEAYQQVIEQTSQAVVQWLEAT